MEKSNKFSAEIPERAVLTVQQHRGGYPSMWQTIESITPKIGCAPHSAQTQSIETPARFGPCFDSDLSIEG